MLWVPSNAGRSERHQKHRLILLMLAVAPFYDLLRGRLFPDVQLLGAWQDILVITLALCAIPKIAHPAFRLRLSWLDIAVIAFIMEYLFSLLFTASVAVWFYMFRWCCLAFAEFLGQCIG